MPADGPRTLARSSHGPRSLGPARWIGPLGLAMFGVLLLVRERSTELVIADVGLGLLIALALWSHLAFHRRRRRDEPVPRKQGLTTAPDHTALE